MTGMRVCIDCPRLIPAGTRCTACARTRDRARGTPAQRGYGPEHRRIRTELVAALTSGHTLECWRCGATITHPAQFDVGHDDNDRTITRGPECRRCNRASRTTGRISPNG